MGGNVLTRILLIRHGNTDAVGKYHTGRAPGVHLNDEGRAQVAALVTRLRPVRLDAIVSSPLERTLESAGPIAQDHGLTIETDARLLEYDVGEWTGASFAALAADPVWQRFNAMRSTTRPPGGELMIDVQQRALAALVDIQRTHPDATVAVVSHADVIRAVLVLLLGMPIDFYFRLDIRPAGISVIELSEGAPRVLQVNGDTVPAEP